MPGASLPGWSAGGLSHGGERIVPLCNSTTDEPSLRSRVQGLLCSRELVALTQVREPSLAESSVQVSRPAFLARAANRHIPPMESFPFPQPAQTLCRRCAGSVGSPHCLFQDACRPPSRFVVFLPLPNGILTITIASSDGDRDFQKGTEKAGCLEMTHLTPNTGWPSSLLSTGGPK